MGDDSTKSFKLKHRTAFISGSTSGIGYGIARVFAREGCSLLVHGRRPLTSDLSAKLSELRVLGAPSIEYYSCDLSDHSALKDMMQRIAQNNKVDILVNNAGSQCVAPIEEMRIEDWDRLIAVNLTAPFLMMQQLLPSMRNWGYGRVINISSAHGIVASPNKSPYVASKHGLVGLSKVAALEFASIGSAESGGVTVNCICPGWVETPLIESQIQELTKLHDGDRSAGIMELVGAKQASRRLSSAEDIGEMALWLCDVRSHNVTGAALSIDGGWTAI